MMPTIPSLLDDWPDWESLGLTAPVPQPPMTADEACAHQVRILAEVSAANPVPAIDCAPGPPSVIALAIASGEPPLTVRRWLEDPGSVGRRARQRLSAAALDCSAPVVYAESWQTHATDRDVPSE